MQLTVIAVGKIKQRFVADGIAEFTKRIRRYANLEVREAKEQPYKEPIGLAKQEQVLAVEQGRILKLIPPGSFVVALDICGVELSSVEFSERIEGLMLSGRSHITFLIGGSLGLARGLLEKCEARLSFGPMTFPHELMRLMLLEQLYRSFTIIRGEPYHK